MITTNHSSPHRQFTRLALQHTVAVSLPAGPVTVRIASTSAIGPEIDVLRATWDAQRPDTWTASSVPHAFEGTAYAASLAGDASDAVPDDTLTFSKLDGPA